MAEVVDLEHDCWVHDGEIILFIVLSFSMLYFCLLWEIPKSKGLFWNLDGSSCGPKEEFAHWRLPSPSALSGLFEMKPAVAACHFCVAMKYWADTLWVWPCLPEDVLLWGGSSPCEHQNYAAALLLDDLLLEGSHGHGSSCPWGPNSVVFSKELCLVSAWNWNPR